MQEWLVWASDVLSGPIIVWGAAAVGFYLSMQSGFVQIRWFPRAMKTVLGGLFDKKKEQHSSFQALATALSGTIGTGNIAGVAVAITIGGAGSLFWMWVSAFLGMASKYTEITLAVRHRQKGENGYFGGPMYYLPKPLCTVFSVCCVAASFGVGNIVQSNTAYLALRAVWPEMPMIAIVCIILASAAIFWCLLGGFRRVESIAATVLPVLAAAYLVFCLSVIALRPEASWKAFCRIFTEAFSFSGVLGGSSGYWIMRAIRTGCAKGIFTNEAGLGSAPIAHANAACAFPAEQGLWGIFEVFFDTIVMCTLTGIVVIGAGFSGQSNGDGITIAMHAFSNTLGEWSGMVVGLSVFCFAFISILTWGGYALSALRFLKTKWQVTLLYTAFYAIAMATAGFWNAEIAWITADILNAMMLLPNLLGILMRNREMKAETERLYAVKYSEKERKEQISFKKG